MACGAVYSNAPAATAGTAATKIKNRYTLDEMINERHGVTRFKATDSQTGQQVALLKSPAGGASGEVTPGFDVELPGGAWPSIAWEKNLLDKAKHPALPRCLDHFSEDGHEYLIEEIPTGEVLWNCWDDAEINWATKWGWLKGIAEALHQLHQVPAIIEGLRPDLVTITPQGQAMINDLADLLPLPLPPNPPIRGTFYTAPEVATARDSTDVRSDHYGFGGMLYALTLGVDLTEKDFDKTGAAKNFIARFPDVHPLMARLVMKTFVRDPLGRFPTDEKKDPTGSLELINFLENCRRNYDQGRLEISSWTTTGIVRTGNEDAFALLHATESRLDDISEYALLIICDGMGGYEAGEIAAQLAIATLRKLVIGHKMFAALRGEPHPSHTEFKAEELKKLFYEALKETNKVVFEAPTQKPPIGKRGMGCTADIVFTDGRQLVIGHVGDSRVYQLKDGRLQQVTRDQTLVNRLVELGQISAEEAENHPRKNELQQAVGGRKDVEPAVYSSTCKAGDWLLITTDGLVNHIKNDEIQEMFQMEAPSAEVAARRLVNFVNLRGATDNSTVITVRIS